VSASLAEHPFEGPCSPEPSSRIPLHLKLAQTSKANPRHTFDSVSTACDRPHSVISVSLVVAECQSFMLTICLSHPRTRKCISPSNLSCLVACTWQTQIQQSCFHPPSPLGRGIRERAASEPGSWLARSCSSRPVITIYLFLLWLCLFAASL
jgi:hypothetical protein